jgi:hypothetical protein
MNDGVRREIEIFASRIINRYFCDSDVEFLISTLSPDIVWMGAGENQRAEGRDAVAECFRAGKGDLFPCDMSDERYVTREISPGVYLCEADSWVQSRPEIPRTCAYTSVSLSYSADGQREFPNTSYT